MEDEKWKILSPKDQPKEEDEEKEEEDDK